MSYPHTRKRHDMILASLIGERVDVRVEAVDQHTSLFSIAVGNSHLSEGKLGVSVALRKEELVKMRNALSDMINHEPGEPA